jgi:hypothetical protein
MFNPIIFPAMQGVMVASMQMMLGIEPKKRPPIKDMPRSDIIVAMEEEMEAQDERV